MIKDLKITKPSTVQLADSTTLNTGFVDMKNFEGVLFVAVGSTLVGATSNVSLKGQLSTADSTSSVYDAEGTVQSTKVGAAGLNYRVLALDVYKPTKRYVRFQINGTSSGAFEVAAIQYGSKRPGSSDMYDSTTIGVRGVVVGATS